jgi:TatD DNase family protein
MDLIDTHAHLNLPDFDKDLDDVIARAAEAGVVGIVDIGVDIPSSKRAIELSKRYECIHPVVGISPHDADGSSESVLSELRTLASHPSVVAVGETGLDFYKNYSTPENQLECFKKQLKIARDLGKAIIIHSRQADDETMSILEEGAAGMKGVMHCFSGTEETASRAIELGFYIGIGGTLTYKNSKLPQRIHHVPIERIVLETDAPYLSPQSRRGKRNEPVFMIETAEKLAELYGLTLEDIARITTLNARDLFSLSVPDTAEIAYQIRDSLYLNITNKCTNMCSFCIRFKTDFVKGHKLNLDHEPSVDEIMNAIKQTESPYREVVFCGYGEPMLRLDVVKDVSTELKKRGVRIRVNTNGLGNLIWKRDVLPELVGLVDEFSVSLNAQNADLYNDICRPEFGPESFQAVLDFIERAASMFEKVTVTAVEIPEVDIQSIKKLAESRGAFFGARHYNVVG